MDRLISLQAAIDEIEYEIEMINSALDSITLDFNARERLRQRRGEAREILNSIQQLPSKQPDTDRIYAELSKAYNVEGLPDEAIGIIGDLMLSLDEPSAQPDNSCDGCRYENADDGVLVPCGFCKRSHPDNYERRTDG